MTDWTTIDSEYEETEVEDTTTLPDGAYEATITEASVDDTEWGATQLTLRFQADYPYGNETRQGTITKWLTLDSAQMADEDIRKRNLGMLKRDLQTLEYHGKPSELERKAGGFVGARVEITVKTKKGTEREWRNVYVNRLVEKAPPRAETAQEALVGAAGDDDIPF